MQRYIAFLRSINVGGRRVAGADLERIFSDIGLSDPTSFLASGNVVFQATPRPSLCIEIETALQESLGYEVPVLLRTPDQVRSIADTQPFTEEQLDFSVGKTQVSLLAEPPSQGATKRVLNMATREDALHVQGRELYWLPAAGMSEAALDTAAIEELLGKQTRRTLNTMQRLTKKFFGGS